MKKKILSAALVLALVLCFLPMTALAANKNANWQALQTAMKGETQPTVPNVFTVDDDALTGVRTIKLLANIKADADDTHLEVKATNLSGKVIILDLNGKTLDRGLAGQSATADGNVIDINRNAELTVKDSVGTGTITGGNITGTGGGVYNGYGTFTMTGGSITGNTSSGSGGGVYNGGTFTLEGGSITDNKTSNDSGGGVFNAYTCTFTMTGGSITGNTASTKSGGGVHNADSGIFTMTGGSITGNTASTYGGGIQSIGTTTFGGTAVVRNNSTSSMQESNVHLNNNTPIKIAETGFQSGADVGITVWESAWAAGTEVAKYFGNPTTIKDNNYTYIVMNNANTTNKGTVYSIVKDNGKYVLAASYTVTGYTGEHGSVTAEKRNYAQDETVTLTVTPAEGYRLKEGSLKVNGGEVEVEGGKFSMPAGAVTVTAEFEPIPTAPIKPLTPARIDFTAISRIVKGVIGLIGFKKTADDIKTVSILAIIFRIVTQILDKIF